MTHYNTFREQLAIAHPAFGHALWEPDPGEEYPPVEVGDVGFTRQGKFHRLFNALLPENHQSHQRFGVPEHYEPLLLSVPRHIDHGTLNPNNFCSYGVTVESGGSDVHAVAPPTSDSAEISFSCTRKDGAALSLPVIARREDTLSQAHFGKWMTRHIDSWFAFSQRHGLGIDMEDIVFVTGCHRTRSWSNIAFYESQANSRVSLSVRAPGNHGTGNPGTTVHWRVLSQRIQGTVLSHGPSGDNLPENQCLFIRGFRVKRLLWIIPRLRGAAGPQPDPPGYNPEPETELVQIPSVPEYQDPLHVLLEYIATQAPDCDMALVHDDDLVQILGVDDGAYPETLQQDVVMNYLQRSKPEIGVMSESWTAKNEGPRCDTEGMTVAMLSGRLHSLDPQASVPLHSHSPSQSSISSSPSPPPFCDTPSPPPHYYIPSHIPQGHELPYIPSAPLTPRVYLNDVLAAPSLQYDMRYLPNQSDLRLSPAVLAEPAANPPLQSLSIRVADLPWKCTVRPNPSLPREYAVVTVQDVLVCLHFHFRTAVKADEYNSMSKPRKAQIFQTFERRVGKDPTQRGKGLRRVDFLGGQIVAQGLVRTESKNDVWDLVVHGVPSSPISSPSTT